MMFHAKDDLPEVRKAVFDTLLKEEFKFYAVIRDKHVIAKKILERQKSRSTYRYHPNQLYDSCVTRLFRDRLHTDNAYQIVFAERGKSDRTLAFRRALEAARQNARAQLGVDGTAPIEILTGKPRDIVCLQVVDYCLWALQRFLEREEDRFLNLIWNKVGVVYDIEDTQINAYGSFYNRKSPFTLEHHQNRSRRI